jgi:Flp pilus assembly pilin Flp
MAERSVPMMQLFKSYWTDESGQGLTEYALILVLVSIGLITVLTIFRDEIGRVIDAIIDALQGAPSGEYESSNAG